MPKENRIASLLKMIGYVIFGLTVLITFIQLPLINPTFLMLLTFFSGFITGMIFIGLGEIIELLQSIHNRQILTTHVEKPAVEEQTPEVTVRKSTLDETERNEITEFFGKKGKAVTDIQPMDEEDYYLVTVDGEKLAVELGGFQPVVRKRY
ncbi:hypothetical protein KP77_05290 [Jeotgalibacillus alimentarius]|uniref:Uncharacterized protein n=1 Tax=Jeotgalibacillus alimentarius TaxID=135826 RepID=A0A0C2WC00_9BACL|nr:hypothetical protein [Jeotgalibacillus alimentarius]KIL53553.1 hypothetical protein KP77_05290 [Jeotgalibacillus alimentarius]